MKVLSLVTTSVLFAVLAQAPITAPVVAQPSTSQPETTQQEFSFDFRVGFLDSCIEQSGGYSPQAAAFCLCGLEELTTTYSSYTEFVQQGEEAPEQVYEFFNTSNETCTARAQTVFSEE